MSLNRKVLKTLKEECPELNEINDEIIGYGYLKDILIIETENRKHYAMFNRTKGIYENLKEYNSNLQELDECLEIEM